jgi:hypothetical protein
MTTIAATGNSSTGAALAALISNGSSAASPAGSTAPATSSSTSSGATSSTGLGPATTVSLSDHAKAVIAKAQADQAVATRLAAQIAASKSAGKNGQMSTGPTFEQIVASAKQSQAPQSGQTSPAASNASGQASPTSGYVFDNAAYQSEQQQAHTNADGSVTSWSQTFRDVLTVPTSPADINDWYNTQGKQLATANEEAPTGSADLVQAIQSRSLTFSSAADIPGLNFHNTFSYSGGEGGGGGGANYTYNSNAAIFSDPKSNYLVLTTGTVISWAKPQAANSTAS